MTPIQSLNVMASRKLAQQRVLRITQEQFDERRRRVEAVRHSRRIEPMNRSAWPFCHGDRGAVGLSRMPIARTRRVNASP
jgi:hypothetical protein